MTTEMLERRRRVLGPNVPIFYDTPVNIVRGEGVWLWDEDGRRYLDCYNNVPHVGHCHPKVVEAIAEQAATLNTHTRYLHEGILEYGERLTAKFSHDLKQLIMVCTGSEANDVALRMAQAKTGKTGFIATDNTFHGNTSAVSQMSTRRPPIGGYQDHIQLVPAPDSVRPVGGHSKSSRRPSPVTSRPQSPDWRQAAKASPVSCCARPFQTRAFPHLNQVSSTQR